nr:MAG TPA: hypothetical protein [Caudoviricetes sp.]
MICIIKKSARSRLQINHKIKIEGISATSPFVRYILI